MNELPVLPNQQHPDDRTTYVGRTYVTYRSHSSGKEYVVNNRVKHNKKRQVLDEDEQRYEYLSRDRY
jgi:hypothetical protein